MKKNTKKEKLSILIKNSDKRRKEFLLLLMKIKNPDGSDYFNSDYINKIIL